MNYNKAIQHEPDSAIHYNNKGLANYHSERLEEAEADFTTAYAKDPKDPIILFNRGNVYLNWNVEEVIGDQNGKDIKYST